MEMPDGNRRQPDADSEAVIWYMRSKAKHLPAEEMRDFESWLRRSPENAAALLAIAERDHRVTPRVASQVSRKGSSISHEYLKHLKKQYFWPKMGLLAATLCAVAGWLFLQDMRLLKLAAVAFGCLVLLMIREVVIGLRVANGYFGTTESEVRDFIQFITAHCDHIDFTDESGKRRPALVPESPAPGSATSATSVSTGALSE